MSNPTWPIYTFRVNLETLRRYDWLQPNRTTLDGNETVSEEDALKATRSTWLTNMFPGVSNIAEHDGVEFTAYGMQAVYLKNTYVKGQPDDLLQLV